MLNLFETIGGNRVSVFGIRGSLLTQIIVVMIIEYCFHMMETQLANGAVSRMVPLLDVISVPA
jgi:hypothetical protein